VFSRAGLLLIVTAACAVLPGASVAASTPSAAEEPILCVPEAILHRQDQTATASTLPFRVFVPNLTRLESPPAATTPGLLALEDRLEELIATTTIPGRFAVAVTDLQTMETVGVATARRQLAGCVTNLFAIIAALRDVDAGAYPLDAVDATIRQTIWASDATAAHDLYEIVGSGDVVAGVRRVAALYDQMGMLHSVVDHPPAYSAEWLGVNVNNYLTAQETNAALALLHRGSVLGPGLTGYLIDAMTGVKPGLNYLTAVVPDPGVVSHKNGFFWTPDGWVDNDVAIVRFGPNLAYAYAISFFSEAVPDLYADIPLGQALVFEAWAYFSTAYPP